MSCQSNLEKCCQCFEILSKDKDPRKMVGCVHNTCAKCLRENLNAKVDSLCCYYCSTVVVLKDLNAFPKTNVPLQKKNSQAETKASEMQEELLLHSQPLEPNYCKFHQKTLDIVCVTDKTLICSYCAIFGNHKDHRLKTLQEFDSQIHHKIEKFQQIRRAYSYEKDDQNKYQDVKPILQKVQANLVALIQKKFSQLEYNLRNAKKLTLSQLHNGVQGVMNHTHDNRDINLIKNKMNKWEAECTTIILELNDIKQNSQKIQVFYQSPLELVQEGNCFLEQIECRRNQYKQRLTNLINSFSINFDEKIKIQNYAGLQYLDSSQILMEEQTSDNPFIAQTRPSLTKQSLTCSSKQIPQNRLLNSASIKSKERINLQETKRTAPTLKYVKSLQNLKKESLQIRSPRFQKKKPIVLGKSQVEINPAVSKFTIPVKQSRELIKVIRDPEKALASFQVNHLGDVFDLSDCNLEDSAILHYVQLARKVCRTKGLKMKGNLLTTDGFQKLVDCLQGVSNLNLNKNLLDINIFEVIVRQKKKLESLKIIHLAQNQITENKNMLGPYFTELKKMGITVVL